MLQHYLCVHIHLAIVFLFLIPAFSHSATLLVLQIHLPIQIHTHLAIVTHVSHSDKVYNIGDCLCVRA